MEDGFAEVAAAIVAGYDAGEMPVPGAEDFAPAFKKWIKVRRLLLYSTLHLIRIKNTDLAWVSYLGEGAFYTNFSVSSPGFIIFLEMSACLITLVLAGCPVCTCKLKTLFGGSKGKYIEPI